MGWSDCAADPFARPPAPPRATTLADLALAALVWVPAAVVLIVAVCK